MNISLNFEFSSNRAFFPSDSTHRKLFEVFRWENQHRKGKGFELNLVWFCCTLEISSSVKALTDAKEAGIGC